ncbi:type IV toxin-antitoxin system AbiEi family antitoxin domain-containing protein [Serinibacter arcticus]|nr:type IV toxin-antitoxin system AbiEi family antitoxin domain-containing protein [Serinibacter arcticus]
MGTDTTPTSAERRLPPIVRAPVPVLLDTSSTAAPTSLRAPVLADLLPAAVVRLATTQHGLLTSSQLAMCGVSVAVAKRRVLTGRWRRPTRGVYDVASSSPLQLRPDARHRRAAALALLAFGGRATAVGFSALACHGVWGLPVHSPEVTCGSARSDRDGLRCREVSLTRSPVQVGAFRCAHPVDALAQALPRCSPRTALGMLDSALHRQVVTEEEVAEVRALLVGRRGAAGLAVVWALVDGRRESPLESWAYYDLDAAGLRPTDIQVRIVDASGVLVARGDIGFRLPDGSWLIVELNGREYHGVAVRDDTRRNAVVATERARVLDYWAEHLGVGGTMVRQVRDVLDRAGAWSAPVSERRRAG